MLTQTKFNDCSPPPQVTLFEVLLGVLDVNDDLMRRVDAFTIIYFWSFIFVAFLLLLNVLLAIIGMYASACPPPPLAQASSSSKHLTALHYSPHPPQWTRTLR